MINVSVNIDVVSDIICSISNYIVNHLYVHFSDMWHVQFYFSEVDDAQFFNGMRKVMLWDS